MTFKLYAATLIVFGVACLLGAVAVFLGWG
jgi:hypothetical protein